MRQISLPFYAKLALVLFSLICMGFIAYIGKDVLAPLCFSFLFAMLLLPVCRFFERKLSLPASIATGLTLGLFIAAFAAVGYAVWVQITLLIKDSPHLWQQITDALTEVRLLIQRRMHINVNQQLRKVESGAVAPSPVFIGETMLSISSMVLFMVFIAIYTFFLLYYRRLLMASLLKIFNPDHEGIIYDIVTQIQFIIKEYITGLFFEMCAVAALAFGALTALGVPYALLLGLITAIFNLIPYVGIFSALIISTLVTLGTVGLTKALMVAASILLVHVIDSNIMMPNIVGSKVRVNALVVVLCVVVGEMFWGLSGMFLSVPIIAVIKIVFDRVESLKPWGHVLGGLETDRPARKPRRWRKREILSEPE